MSGLDALIPISFGTLYVIVNAILLIFSLMTDRHNIGIATFINLFLLGYVVDFSHKTLRLLLPNPSVPVRIMCLLFGIVLICIGASLYMTADQGVSTYDAVANVMSGKWKIARFKYCRIATDLVCVLIGVGTYWIAGGRNIMSIAGIGTIITAFFMGPLIEFFNEKLARPLLRD